MTIEVDDKIADLMRKLQAKAIQRGLSFASYLQGIVEAQPDAPVNCDCSVAEFDLVMTEIGALTAGVQSLPAGFTRADIYGDHD